MEQENEGLESFLIEEEIINEDGEVLDWLAYWDATLMVFVLDLTLEEE